MGHNRFWAVDNVYCKQNGGDYDFVVEKKGDAPDFNNFAWPTEQRFWDDLLYAPFTFPPPFVQWGKNQLCVLDRHYAGAA